MLNELCRKNKKKWIQEALLAPPAAQKPTPVCIISDQKAHVAAGPPSPQPAFARLGHPAGGMRLPQVMGVPWPRHTRPAKGAQVTSVPAPGPLSWRKSSLPSTPGICGGVSPHSFLPPCAPTATLLSPASPAAHTDPARPQLGAGKLPTDLGLHPYLISSPCPSAHNSSRLHSVPRTHPPCSRCRTSACPESPSWLFLTFISFPNVAPGGLL